MSSIQEIWNNSGYTGTDMTVAQTNTNMMTNTAIMIVECLFKWIHCLKVNYLNDDKFNFSFLAIEVTLGPSYGGSAMSLTQSDYDNKPSQSNETPTNVTLSMKLISEKITEWVKSMEKDEEPVLTERGKVKQSDKLLK